MKRYSLTRLAGQDIDGIWEYIATKLGNPDAADRITDSLYHSFSTLASFPFMGTLADDLTDILPGT